MWSDNFGNCIKISSVLDGINDTILNANKSLLVNTFDINAFRSILKNLKYINIQKQILDNVYNILTNINTNNNTITNNNNDSIRLIDLHKDTLINIMQFLTIKDINNYESVSKECCYIGRIPACVRYINHEWTSFPCKRSYQRFKQLDTLKICCEFPKINYQFINSIAKNLKEISFKYWNYQINLGLFKSLQSIHVATKICPIKMGIKNVINNLQFLSFKQVRIISTSSQVDHLMESELKESLQQSNLKVFNVQNERNIFELFPIFTFNMIRYAHDSLLCLSLDFRNLEDIILRLKTDKTILKFNQLEGIYAIFTIYCIYVLKTDMHK